MKSITRLLASASVVLLAAASANAQFYKLHNVDIGGGALGQFTENLPANSLNYTSQTATESFGGMFTVREHPVSWAGIEVNYSYSEYTQRYQPFSPVTGGALSPVNLHNDAHEATGAYLFHPHFRTLQPFIAIGGGYIDFVPSNNGISNQWRGTGLVEVGLDIPTSNPHMGFRLQGRELVYRNPNFFQSAISSRTWASTSQPSFGVWYRF